MKSRILTYITATTLFAALAIPVRLAAQGQQENNKQPRNRLADLETSAGPNSSPVTLNDAGVKVDWSATSTPKPPTGNPLTCGGVEDDANGASGILSSTLPVSDDAAGSQSQRSAPRPSRCNSASLGPDNPCASTLIADGHGPGTRVQSFRRPVRRSIERTAAAGAVNRSASLRGAPLRSAPSGDSPVTGGRGP